MEREVGGGIGMGNICKPMAVSFQCMTKSTTIKKNNKKSHDMSIVKVQNITPVHSRVVRCHQTKQRHHMLSKVFADLEKVFSLKWRCPPWEAFY